MFDLKEARKEGYTDSEIIAFLTTQYPKFAVADAVKEGYSLDEIVSHLQTPTTVRSEAPALDLKLRAATGSFNPNPPNIVPQEADIPLLSRTQIGNQLGEAIAEQGGKMGHPILGALAGTTAVAPIEAYNAIMSPENVIGGEILGRALAPLGEGLASLLRSWGEKAALFAIGSIKKIAEMMGSESLPALARFLLSPVKLGSKEFPAIISATSSPEKMLKAAKSIQLAAGQVLEKINPVVDEAINANPSVIDLKGILDELYKMRDRILKISPNTSAPDIAQFTKVISDYEQILQEWTKGNLTDLFTSLRALKTDLGAAVYRFGPELLSKAAIGDSYKVIAEGIDVAAHGAKPEIGAAFAEANEVYTKASAVVDALQGKVNKLADQFFSGFAKAVGTLGAIAGLGAKSLLTGPAAFMTAKTLESYGPQAIALGLNKAANIIPPIVTGVTKGTIPAASAISSALNQ